MPRLSRTLRAALVSTATAALTFTACVTTPETHRKQVNFVPDSQMNAMGAEAFTEMLKTEKISSDAKLTAAVVDVGRRIATASGKNYQWEFKLFDSKDVNAFCLPGGKVGVYTGLLPVAKTNAGLAAVLGHEVAHAILRHGAERMSQQLLLTGGLIAVDAAMRNSEQRGLIMGALGLGAQFGVMLPYSRKHESEADEVGLTYMAKAGYDPREAVALWQRMAQQGSRPPEILSTHPDPANRARIIERDLPSVMPYYDKSQKVPTEPI
jgi:predicted Zn-dependent protease